MSALNKGDPVLSNSNAMTWSISTGSQKQPSSLSMNLSFKMAIPPIPCQDDKKLDFQVHDQHSASTHSSGHSFPEVACAGERKTVEESISFMEPGSPTMQGKAGEGYTKSTLSSQDYASPPSHFDFGQPIGPVPFTYPNNFYSELVAAYGPHAMVHPQMMCMTTSTRVPLPLDLPQDEPIFVNARQYHAILRRRQYRAKLEAQNKVTKDRKPYLHESRHRHALNRARGPGGRFLNVKKLQESNNGTSDGRYNSGFGHSQSTKNMRGAETHHTGKYTETIPATGVTYHQQDYGFSVYESPEYAGSTRLCVGSFPWRHTTLPPGAPVTGLPVK